MAFDKGLLSLEKWIAEAQQGRNELFRILS